MSRRALELVGCAGLALVALAALTSGLAAAQAQTGCTMDTQCKGDRVCDDGVCRPPPAATGSCAVDADCPGAELCVDGACRLTDEPAPRSEPLPPRPAAARPAPPPPRPAATTPAPPADGAETAPVPAERPRRTGLAEDGALVGGLVSAGDSSYAALGASSAFGGYLSHQVALMLTSSYDLVLTEPMVSLFTFGAGLRWSSASSNNSLRFGAALASLGSSDEYTETLYGPALTADLVLVGRGKRGLGLGLVAASFDGITVVRLGLGFALFR